VRDLSLHLLDLVQNSITAGASLITIRLSLEESGMLTMTLEDNGKGMSPELLERVTSPFATTRTTRKVGLGIPMMKENAEKAGGSFTLESEEGKGTVLTATMDTRNIDCLPLGDLPSTMASIIMGSPDNPEFSLRCSSPGGEMSFSTEEIRPLLEGVSLAEPSVVQWIRESLDEEIQPILGGIMK